MIRKAARIAHRTLIVVLTLGAGVTVVAWCTSSVWGQPPMPFHKGPFFYEDYRVSEDAPREYHAKLRLFIGTEVHLFVVDGRGVLMYVTRTDIGNELREIELEWGRFWIARKRTPIWSRKPAVGKQYNEEVLYWAGPNPTPSQLEFLYSTQTVYSTISTPLWFVLFVFATYPTIAFTCGPLRRRRRRKRGLCVNCGYNLRGLPEPRCPECGREFER